MTTLETMNFDNLALRSLPLDTEQDNFTRQVDSSGQATSLIKHGHGSDPGLLQSGRDFNLRSVLSPGTISRTTFTALLLAKILEHAIKLI